MADNTTALRRIIDEIYPRIVALRRDFHRHPEMGYREVRTAGIVSRELKRLGIPHRTKVGRTGVVGVLRGKRSGPCVALRADMDALPIREENVRLPWRSANPGVMHACGHDGHTANLVGVAHVLARMRDRLAGSVKLLFQPSEEGGAGAVEMIKDGALRNPKPDLVYAFHTGAAIPAGKVAWKSGPMCAATTSIDVTFRGRGGHAAAPHETIDPIVMSAQFLEAVQTIVSRRVDPLDQTVVTFGMWNAGTARNVIPDEAALFGTLRTYRDAVQRLASREVRRIAANVARAAGGRVALRIVCRYPTVVNDRRASEFLRDVALEAVGPSEVIPAEPMMGGEDFSYFLAEVPGCFFRVGNGTPDTPAHSPRFDFNDHTLKTAMLVMSLLALRRLSSLQGAT